MKTIYLVIGIENETQNVGTIRAFEKLEDARKDLEMRNKLIDDTTYIIEEHIVY